MKGYFYEKTYSRRHDGKVFARRYSRSFEFGQDDGGNKSKPRDLVGSELVIDAGTKTDPRPSNAIEASISRARTRVRVLAFANPTLVGLLTLTFTDIPSESIAQERFKLYQQKVRRHYPGWQFLGVKELQKRGSIHYHLLVNFCPGQVHKPLWNAPMQQQSELWEYGISDYRPIQGDDNFKVELYLLKYLTKNVQKLFKTYYVRSRNLEEPRVAYIRERRPYPPNAEGLFTTIIHNNYVDHFEITEYTYDRLNHKEESWHNHK